MRFEDLMDFIDRIRAISARIPMQIEHLKTEEATKHALVMPFIQCLGYDVFNPLEVVPEYTADVGLKKGEKVDYAILRDSKPIIIFECKHAKADLDKEHASQLYRYFHTVHARFGVLTNGIVYRFFTDLDSANKMDEKPFLELNLLDIKDPIVEELKAFRKDTFDENRVLSAAEELKYTGGIKLLLAKQLADPDEDLLKFFMGHVYTGRATQSAKERFAPIFTKAFRMFLSDQLNARLKSALGDDAPEVEAKSETSQPAAGEAAAPAPAPTNDDGIVTTEEEVEGYQIVRAILAATTDPMRVVMRDTKSYCGVLLDDNNRKPICRLRFNATQKYLGVFDAEKNETKHPIDKITDIFRHADVLKAVVAVYDAPQPSSPT